MSNDFYVYLLLDPRRYYLPFYIGKGKGDRANHHLKYESHAKTNTFKKSVIQKIRISGQEPKVMFWAVNLTESEAFDLEKQLIARFGRRDLKTGILTNLSEGGFGNAGRKFTEEHRRKMSEAAKGRKHTDESKAKISLKRKGVLASEETKKKLSEAKKGKGVGSANPMYGRRGELHHNYGKEGLTGEKNGMFGRRHSPETIEKIRQKALARK
jgi:hypothetical protein